MVDSTDHVTGKAGLTLTIRGSKDGAAFAAIAPAVTELEAGFYSLALSSAHTDTLGDLALHITAAGADPTDLVDQVVVDLPGASVASVSGAVGSVTGNVGGSVASVIADVGITQSGADKVWGSAARTLTGFGTLVADAAAAVWAAATRELTSGANIVLAKGTGVTGFNDPAAAAVATAVRTELAPELVRIDVAVSSRLAAGDYLAPDNVGIGTAIAGIDAVFARTDVAISSRAVAGDAMTLTAGERTSVAAAVMASTVEGSITLTKACRAVLAALAAKCSGMATPSVSFRDTADTKDRVTATVDEFGNRSAVTLDLD